MFTVWGLNPKFMGVLSVTSMGFGSGHQNIKSILENEQRLLK